MVDQKRVTNSQSPSAVAILFWVIRHLAIESIISVCHKRRISNQKITIRTENIDLPNFKDVG